MSLLVRPLSDAHLEFSQGRMPVPELPTDRETVLVLAGDIGLAVKPHTYVDFVGEMSGRFRDVVYVMGNHEHYKGKFPTSHAKIWNQLVDYDNVHVLEKECVVIGGVAFVGATMWTNMGNHDAVLMEMARYSMNDYGDVRTGPLSEPWQRKLRPSDTVADFMNARHFLFEEIKNQKAKGNKVVVVTHHSCSFLSISPEFKGDPINGAYASELFENIMELGDDQPELWVHGHLHTNSDYLIGTTRVLCNPRGYFGTGDSRDLNSNFNPQLVVEI